MEHWTNIHICSHKKAERGTGLPIYCCITRLFHRNLLSCCFDHYYCFPFSPLIHHSLTFKNCLLTHTHSAQGLSITEHMGHKMNDFLPSCRASSPTLLHTSHRHRQGPATNTSSLMSSREISSHLGDFRRHHHLHYRSHQHAGATGHELQQMEAAVLLYVA